MHSSFASSFTRTWPVARLLFWGLVCAALQACSSATVPAAVYDFGFTPTTQTRSANNLFTCKMPPLNLSDIASSSLFDSDAMHYRLLYSSELQTQIYANHRWSMPPAQLVMQRIQSQFTEQGVTLLDAGMTNSSGWQLRLELDDFSHYFSDPTHSYAQLKLRASLLKGHNLLSQANFTQQAPAATANASSGAQAMRVATDAIIVDLSHWLCNQTNP